MEYQRNRRPFTFYVTKTPAPYKQQLLKYFLLPFAFLLLVTTGYCQLDKGVWIVGGSGSFNSYHRDFRTPTYTVLYNATDITISPSIGYFIKDKLVFGLSPSYLLQKQKDRGSAGPAGGGQLNFSWLELGPFGRWYLLNKANNYNIVGDISYHYGLQSNFGSNTRRSNTFKALVGPVLYFNSSVGIELLMGYSSRREFYAQETRNFSKGLLTTIGFQIHLEKDN